MKHKLFLLFIALTFTILAPACKPSVPYKDFKLSMQKVNGEWITATYRLPEDTYFYIQENRGSYYLSFARTKAGFFDNPKFGLVKNAIIDYRIEQ